MDPAKRTAPCVALLSGNLGNRLFQYFAVLGLWDASISGDITGIAFPEWHKEFPYFGPDDFNQTILINTVDDFDILFLAKRLKSEPSTYIINRSHLQRQEFFATRERCASAFSIGEVHEGLDPDALLINIRAGDLLTGHAKHYPLTPVEYYQAIVEETRRQPVFIGQLEDGPYVDKLRRSFPSADFLPSLGPRRDFDTIRRARFLVPAVSTFSLAAAWLSDAEEIFLPVNGFLNPAHLPEIDLLPLADPRYRFDLFPLNFAMPELEALEFHKTLVGRWKRVSRSTLQTIRSERPFNKRLAGASRSGAYPGFDEVAYIRRNADASESVSWGFYHNPLHHYLDVGRLTDTVRQERVGHRLPNLALACPAWQSSRSRWSRGRTIAEDAERALNGHPEKDYGFHTALENDPWWMVDCRLDFMLKTIRVFNRKGPVLLQERLPRLRIEWSRDSVSWHVLYEADGIFGVSPNEMKPLALDFDDNTICRYIRLTAPGKTYLHLAEVEVMGVPT